MKLAIEKTADGSPTLYREDLDEHYHSVKGALAESQYIYVDLGWREAALRMKSTRPVESVSPSSRDAINVFEVGFGTGLNAVLTAQAALESKIRTLYYSVELYPLAKHVTDQLLPYQPEEYQTLYQSIHAAEWDKEVEINPYFQLIKMQVNLLELTLTLHPDVVYFDAFAPEKQPEMWDEAIFGKIYDAMKPGAVLTTYCAKGAIRRMLQQIGFLTERLPGPPGGKREVLRAKKM